MIDAFEARLADLLADRLAASPLVERVTRPREGLPATPVDRARVTVRVLTAEPGEEWGDDHLERLPTQDDGGRPLRPVLRLAGDASIEVSVGAPTSEAERLAQRAALVRGADAILVTLHDEAIRGGTAFLTDEDLGFSLDGFRLRRVDGGADPTADPLVRRAVYAYTGRFWPVEPAVLGDLIDHVLARMAVLPAGLPEGVGVRAGDPDLDVPIVVDLRAWGGAEPRLVARLGGATPPGSLVGTTDGAPPGFVSYLPQDDGSYHVVYRPPAQLGEGTRVRIDLAAAREERPSVAVGSVSLEVNP